MATTKTLNKIHIFPNQASYTANASSVGANDIYLIRDSAWGITGRNEQNGYVKLPNGLTIQWGVVTAPATEASYTVTFPISFDYNCYSMNVSTDLSIYNSTILEYANIHPQIMSLSKTGATLYSQHSQEANGLTTRSYWIAIGQ